MSSFRPDFRISRQRGWTVIWGVHDLGLEFQIKGETHYGWAPVNVFAPWGLIQGRLETTLIGFAYETTPGAPINAGQTSGAADDPTAAGPGSTNRKERRDLLQ